MKPKNIRTNNSQSRLSKLQKELAKKIGDPVINSLVAAGDADESKGKWVDGAKTHKKVQQSLNDGYDHDPRKDPESHKAWKLNSATILNAENPRIKAGEDPEKVFQLDPMTGRYVEK